MFVAWGRCEFRPSLGSSKVHLTDISLSDTTPSHLAAPSNRAELARRAGAGDTRFHWLALAAALAVVVIFAGVITSLVLGAMPAFKAFGFGFITDEAWRPTRERFGALGSIYGTLVTSAIAMLIALPVGIGVAVKKSPKA